MYKQARSHHEPSNPSLLCPYHTTNTTRLIVLRYIPLPCPNNTIRTTRIADLSLSHESSLCCQLTALRPSLFPTHWTIHRTSYFPTHWTIHRSTYFPTIWSTYWTTH